MLHDQKLRPSSIHHKWLWYGEWSHLIGLPWLQTGLEAEEDEGPGEDVEEEGEADTEGGQEHRADGVGASKSEMSVVFIMFDIAFYFIIKCGDFVLCVQFLLRGVVLVLLVAEVHRRMDIIWLVWEKLLVLLEKLFITTWPL